jgi:type VI secretion system protein ImpA
MSADWEGVELLAPIAPDRPCGESLEDTALLASFDTFRLFGQARPLDAPAEKDKGDASPAKPVDPPDWRAIREKSLETLAKSKDLRVLAHLGTAVLRTDGLPAFSRTLEAASHWLTAFWAQAYPLVDEDAILRRNALNCFADPMAVVDGLRRLPLVKSPQYGTFSLRDIEIAAGQVAPRDGDTRPDENHINAAFASMPLDDLTQLQASAANARAALQSIDARMRESAGSEATPTFDPLAAQLASLDRVLKAQLAARPNGDGATAENTDGGAGGTVAAAGTVGAIRTRQDATRALDAVADFFRQTEPSSPIPLFLDRAKRLVAKDFLEVLADIAPEAVGQARAAGGLKQGE